MKSQYEKKRLITFDRIKIKSNYKYLLDTNYMNYLKVPAKVDELCAILQAK